jgi:hypothetical protein
MNTVEVYYELSSGLFHIDLDWTTESTFATQPDRKVEIIEAVLGVLLGASFVTRSR